MKTKALTFIATLLLLTACSSSETAKTSIVTAPVAETPVAPETGKVVAPAAKPAMAADKPAIAPASISTEITGTIVRFECGDNCYLVIKPKSGAEISGLCVAEACKPWNAATVIPKELIGKAVTVTTGFDKQLDGSGNVMGEFLSFNTVVVAG